MILPKIPFSRKTFSTEWHWCQVSFASSYSHFVRGYRMSSLYSVSRKSMYHFICP